MFNRPLKRRFCGRLAADGVQSSDPGTTQAPRLPKNVCIHPAAMHCSAPPGVKACPVSSCHGAASGVRRTAPPEAALSAVCAAVLMVVLMLVSGGDAACTGGSPAPPTVGSPDAVMCTAVVTPPLGAVALVCTPPWHGTSAPPTTRNASVTVMLCLPEAGDVSHSAAAINGQDVCCGSDYPTGNGSEHTVQFAPAPGGNGGELWPWKGLHLAMTLVNASHVVAEVDARVVPGAAFYPWVGDFPVAGDYRRSRGICVADVDNDGDNDVFHAVERRQDQLLMNTGGGNFTDDATMRSVAGSSTALHHGCGFADVDGEVHGLGLSRCSCVFETKNVC